MEAKDKHGISVVLAAIWEGHSKCVAFLISKVRENGSIHKFKYVKKKSKDRLRDAAL